MNLLMSLFMVFALVEVGMVRVAFASSRQNGPIITYGDTYEVAYGAHNIVLLNQGTEVQLFLDQSDGSGIQSKLSYTSGFFHMNIKLAANDSGGVVTAFYLRSRDGTELDFEFLGNREGKPITVQTNVYLKGKGGREQRIHPWFDPTASFHTYIILWNQHQIVFFVDEFPIRVFKNRETGVGFPAEPMQVIATIWNGDSWATDGGKAKIIWAHAPFIASFQGFAIDGCPSDRESCNSPKFWWNGKQYWNLSPDQERRHQIVKQKFMTYDYCNDRPRYRTPPPECPQ